VDKQIIINELKNIIGEYLKTQGLDLIDLIYRYEGRDLYLRILVDRPEGGITLDECKNLNQEIGKIIDEKNILQQSYILEVSSPGIDRPLKEKNDFLHCIGRKVKIFLNEKVNDKLEWDGIIIKAEDGSIYIEVKGEIIQIPISKINKAKQIIE
jgi:ribosome maturation factor RimP